MPKIMKFLTKAKDYVVLVAALVMLWAAQMTWLTDTLKGDMWLAWVLLTYAAVGIAHQFGYLKKLL